MRAIKTSIIAALALSTPALAADWGGASATPTPMPEGVSCAKDCAGLSSARIGSTVRVTGSSLAAVAKVVFLGRRGSSDDVRARPAKTTDEVVEVVVPKGAVGGPLVLVTGDDARSEPTPPIDIDPGATKLAASSIGSVDAKVEFRRAFLGGKPAALNYMVQGGSPTEITVGLYPAGGDTAVAAWSPGAVEPGTVQRIRWNGKDRATGKVAARGRYEFRVYTGSPDSASAAQAGPTAASSFLFLDHQFPIRGRHDYGSGAAAFGAGRTGHIHQGQDVFAKCGTPLVAARGGKVKFAGFQSRAGNYIVIDGEATGQDYVYMHLQAPALFSKGDAVRTGDAIGAVGDTGDADGCHLHFELWSAPGWYTGGEPVDPLPALRAWDQFS
jgi:murein DD-endopeptidase MepM/ murein hydrolase activator NlpD